MLKTLHKDLSYIAILGSLAAAHCLFGATAQAAPTISSISGSISNGSAISISGSGFGNIGPTVVIFDDFEKGSNGTNISTVSNSAQVSQWSYIQASCESRYPIYTTEWAHSGSKSMKSDWATSSSCQEPSILAGINFPSTTEVFHTFWTMVPSGKNVPGDNATGGNPTGPNWKLTWVFGPGRWPDSDYISSTVLSNTLGSPGGTYGILYDDFTTFGGNTRFDGGWYTPDWVKGQWKRFNVHHKGGQSTGTITLTEFTSSGPVNRFAGSQTFTLLDGHYWSRMTVPGYGRGYTKDGVTLYDDIYLAIGPGARARVEIGNAPSYGKCTNAAIATVTSWSDTSLQATIRQGSFSNGDQTYIYVFDANGNVNAQGYPVTVGSGSSSNVLPPTGLRVLPQ